MPDEEERGASVWISQAPRFLQAGSVTVIRRTSAVVVTLVPAVAAVAAGETSGRDRGASEPKANRAPHSSSFEEEIDEMKGWLVDRADWMDAHINEP